MEDIGSPMPSVALHLPDWLAKFRFFLCVCGLDRDHNTSACQMEICQSRNAYHIWFLSFCTFWPEYEKNTTNMSVVYTRVMEKSLLQGIAIHLDQENQQPQNPMNFIKANETFCNLNHDMLSILIPLFYFKVWGIKHNCYLH